MRATLQKIMWFDLILAILLYVINANVWAFLIGITGLSSAALYVILDWSGELDDIDKSEADNGKRKF